MTQKWCADVFKIQKTVIPYKLFLVLDQLAKGPKVYQANQRLQSLNMSAETFWIVKVCVY